MKGRFLALIAALSLALTACGTRLSEAEKAQMLAGDVLVDGRGAAVNTDVADVTGPDVTGELGTGRDASRPSSDAPFSTENSAADTNTEAPATAPQQGSGSATATGVDYGKPASGDPVQVGYMYISDLDGFAETFGGTNPLGDQKALFNVVADYMNAHGGLGGRPIELVPYGAEIAGSKTYSQSEQEACTTWTQDNDVVAVVVAEIGTSNNLVKCLNDAEVLFITVQGGAKVASDWLRYPYNTSPMELAADVLARRMAHVAVDRGVVKSGDAIGVLGYDYPSNHAAIEAFRAEAESLGLTVVAYEVHTPKSTADISQSAAGLPSAVLAMKTADAKAVVSLCTGCMNLYMQEAERQDYYPTYVVSTYDNPFGLANGRDPRILEDSIAIGWNPNADVDLYNDPEIWTNPTYELCREIEAPNGINDTANLKVSQSVCGSLLLLHETAKSYGGTDITGTTLLEGKNLIGTSWPSTTSFSPLFNERYPGSASQFRTMTYDAAVGTYVYDSTTLHPFQ